MPRIQYQTFNFRAETLARIKQAQDIIEIYAAQGYDLTLRQLYYQFVARDLIPNKQSEYKRLGDLVNNARLAGLIDWDHIVDRTRGMESNSHWDSPEDILDAVAKQFRYDTWDDQPHRIEVWVEKEALAGVFERVCRELDIAWFSCRGYSSQTALWDAAQRLLGYQEAGQRPVILHFGDHDPSGIDMTRDIQDRLRMFGARAVVDRLALNMDQIEEYEPPPNPAKDTDSRFNGYQDLHGDESWELDALEPNVLAEMVREAVKSYRNDDLYRRKLQQQAEARTLLEATAENWQDVTDYLNESGYWERPELEAEEGGL